VEGELDPVLLDVEAEPAASEDPEEQAAAPTATPARISAMLQRLARSIRLAGLRWSSRVVLFMISPSRPPPRPRSRCLQ
jgi:hypothetical protein